MPGTPDTFHHQRMTFRPEIHRFHLAPFDATEPPTNTPAPHEIDRARNILIRHIAEQTHTADATPGGAWRNDHMVHALVTVDLGGPNLPFKALRHLVEEWPPGGEFPTAEAVDFYELECDEFLRSAGYGQPRFFLDRSGGQK